MLLGGATLSLRGGGTRARIRWGLLLPRVSAQRIQLRVHGQAGGR